MNNTSETIFLSRKTKFYSLLRYWLVSRATSSSSSSFPKHNYKHNCKNKFQSRMTRDQSKSSKGSFAKRCCNHHVRKVDIEHVSNQNNSDIAGSI